MGKAVTIARQWLRDGNVIPDATGTTYIIVAADQGKDIALRETATNADGTRSATSSVVSIPVAATFSSPLDLNMDLAEVYDLTNFANLRANGDGTGAITGVNQDVRYLMDSGPRGNHFASHTSDFVPAISKAGYVDWNNSAFKPAAPFTGIEEDMEIYVVANTAAEGTGNGGWMLLGTADSTRNYAGLALSGLTTSTILDFTNATYMRGKNDVITNSRNELFNAWRSPTPTENVVMGAREIRGLPADFNTRILPLAHHQLIRRFTGSVYYIVVTRKLITTKRFDLITYLEGIGGLI